MLFLYGAGDEDLAAKLLKQIAPDIEARTLGIFGFKTPPLPEEDDVLLIMGAQALAQLKETGLAPKNRAIQSMREEVIASPRGGKIMVTYSPDVTWSDSANATLMRYDIALARRLILTGSIAPKVGKYEWVTAEKFCSLVDQWAEASLKKPMAASLDLETMGFYPMLPGKEIVTVQITNKPGRAWVLHMLIDVQTTAQRVAVAAALHKLLNTPTIKLRGANLKFDLGWIWEKFSIDCTNFSMDTLLVGSLLDENRSNGLSWHCKEHTDLGGYDAPFERKYDKGKMETVPKDDPDFLVYAGGDVDGVLQVSEVQLGLLNDQPALARFYTRLLHPAVRAFEKVERRGLLVDTERYKELEDELIKERDESYAEAIRLIPARIKAKHAKAGLKFSRPSLLKDILFSEMGFDLVPQKWTDGGAVSTDKGHLQLVLGGAGNRPEAEAEAFINAFSRWSSADKMLGTYVYGFLEHLRPDGRFHPTYLLYNGAMFESSRGGSQQGGTVTGRTSAKDPAVQCMVGETMVLTDQGEKRLDWLVAKGGAGLRVMTHIGQWRGIVGVYENGVKPVFQLDVEDNRSIVCTGNHPILTARGWVRADQVEVGDVCYVSRAQNSREDQPDVLLVGGHEEPVPVPDVEGLEELRGSGNNGLRPMAEVRELSGRHGEKTEGRVFHREARCEWKLRARKLHLGHAAGAIGEPEKHQEDRVRRQDPDGSSVGARVRDQSGSSALSAGTAWDAHGASLEEGLPAEASQFQESRVVAVRLVGQRETFDLTIQSSHSFVANGVVVHNTIPKHLKKDQKPWPTMLRRCFVAPEGHSFFECDFSQGELRVTAVVANERTMLKAYAEGRDLHCVTGAGFADMSYDEFKTAYDRMDDKDPTLDKQLAWKVETFRQQAKSANFGLLYGMGAEGFMIYARDSFGVHMSVAEATQRRRDFFRTYPGLVDWHDNTRRLVRRMGKVVSPLGRVRHLPLARSPNSQARSSAERQAINSPIQSCLSDMCLLSIVRADAELESEGLQIVGMTHDSIYGYVPTAKAQAITARVCEIMATLPLHDLFGWKPTLEFPADVKYGPSWGEVKKPKPLAMAA